MTQHNLTKAPKKDVEEDEEAKNEKGNPNDTTDEENKSSNQGKPKRKIIFNLLTASAIVICLVGMTELSSIQERKFHYFKSFMLVWVSNTLNPLVIFVYRLIRRVKNKERIGDFKLKEIIQHGRFQSLKGFFGMCLLSTTFWILQYYFYLLSVSYTSSGSSIAIFNSAAVLIYLLSLAFLKEKLTLFKVFAVGFSIGGCVMIGVSDALKANKKDYPQAWLGDRKSVF